MRKILSVCLVIAALFLVFGSACSAAPGSIVPVQNFKAHLKAAAGGRAFEAELICASYEDISLNFTSPENISGISIKTAQDAYAVDICGVSGSLPYTDLGDTALINVIIGSVKAFVFTNHGAFKRDMKSRNYSASLTVNGVPAEAEFSDAGRLLSLSSGDIGLRAEFSYE